MNIKDIIWLSGLLEGEGYFMVKEDSSRRSKYMIAVRMTDKDVVQKVARLFDCAVQFKRRQDRKYKDIWCAEVYGDKAIAWAMTIYSLMGERRRIRIREMIAIWKQHIKYRRLKIAS